MNTKKNSFFSPNILFVFTFIFCIAFFTQKSFADDYEYSLKNYVNNDLIHFPGAIAHKEFIYSSLINAHYEFEKNKSKALFNKLLVSADSFPDKNITCLIYARVALRYADVADSDCFSILERGFKIANKHKVVAGKLELLQAKALIKNVEEADLKKKVALWKEVLTEAAIYDNKPVMANAIHELAFVFYYGQEYDSSSYYISVALNDYADYYSNHRLIGFYNALGLMDNKAKNFRSAINYFNKTIALAIEAKDTAWIGIASGNKGMSYYKLGIYDSALVNLKIDMQYSLQGEEYGSAASAMITLGELYRNQYNNRDSSEIYLKRAAETAKFGRQDELLRTYNNIQKYYAQQKDYAQAYKYFQEYIYLKDSINPLMIETQLKSVEKKFELEKKDAEIQILESENQLQRKETQQNRLIVAALVIIISLLTIILVIVYDVKEKNKKVNIEITQKNNAITKQANQLKLLNEIKDKIFSILSHDMKSPIASLKNTFDLLDANLITEAEFKMIREKVSNQLSNLNIVLDNLLQWSKSQIRGEVEHEGTNVKVNEIINRNINLLENQITNKQLNVDFRNNEEIIVFGDFNQIDIVVRNLLSNAIKFSFKRGQISIVAEKENNHVKIAFKDEGIGIEHKYLRQLFDVKKLRKEYGTAGESGTGLGLWLCKSFIEKNKGTIAVESEAGKGSTFYITLPAAMAQ
jgi:two-component system, sensor histidine kinase and response regulator